MTVIRHRPYATNHRPIQLIIIITWRPSFGTQFWAGVGWVAKHVGKFVICKTCWQPQAKPGLSVEVLAPLLSDGRAMTRSAWCLAHQRICSVKTAKRHVAGTSCRPFSKKGTRLGLMDCETVYLLAWIGMRLECQEGDILQENVPNSDCSLFKRFLFHLYFMDVWVGDPTTFGWPFARSRQFIRFRHRSKCLAEISPVSNFMKMFWRAASFEWEQIYFMHQQKNRNAGVVENELEQELQWARSRPTRRAKSLSEPVTLENHSEPFRACLTDTEELFWQGYQHKFPGKAGQLNQDSLSGHGMASLKGCLHTLIANCHLIFSDKCKPERWLVGTEMLTSMGFPVLPGLLEEGEVLPGFESID